MHELSLPSATYCRLSVALIDPLLLLPLLHLSFSLQPCSSFFYFSPHPHATGMGRLSYWFLFLPWMGRCGGCREGGRGRGG